MNVPETVAKIRLKYHLNMIDLVNAGNQLHFISDEKADNANKNHLKNCIDCYERLGVKMPKVFVDFAKEQRSQQDLFLLVFNMVRSC